MTWKLIPFPVSPLIFLGEMFLPQRGRVTLHFLNLFPCSSPVQPFVPISGTHQFWPYIPPVTCPWPVALRPRRSYSYSTKPSALPTSTSSLSDSQTLSWCKPGLVSTPLCLCTNILSALGAANNCRASLIFLWCLAYHRYSVSFSW